MINKTQAEIMCNWKTSADKPTVSVICNTYNQSRYIGSALDSFLMQETDFPFEVIVHEDASVDNTADIIREYEKKFPDIIKPIYEKENQYSKNRDIIMEIDLPAAGGKYIAFCEGDDYWTDKTKLQKSFDYMEKHDECSLVSHLTEVESGTSKKRTKYNPDFLQRGGIISSDEIILETNIIQTSSFFMRRKLLDNNTAIFSRFRSFDWIMVVLAATEGYVYIIPQNMSVYRFMTAYSYSKDTGNDNQKMIKMLQYIYDTTTVINKYRNYAYTAVLKEKKRRVKFDMYIISGNIRKLRSPQYRDLYKKMSFTDHIRVMIRLLPKPLQAFYTDVLKPRLLYFYFRVNESRGFAVYKR